MLPSDISSRFFTKKSSRILTDRYPRISSQTPSGITLEIFVEIRLQNFQQGFIQKLFYKFFQYFCSGNLREFPTEICTRNSLISPLKSSSTDSIGNSHRHVLRNSLNIPSRRIFRQRYLLNYFQ